MRRTYAPASYGEAVKSPASALHARLLDDVVAVRRDLHAHPELGWAEHHATAVVGQWMTGLGATSLPCPTPTGGVFAVDGGRPGRTVLVRADLDALPLVEEVDLPFRSQIDGVMHACGHDAHTAMALGVAASVAAQAADLPGRYVFLFQPAEELGGGARAMVDGGVLEAIRADALVGAHVISGLPAGLVTVTPEIAMAGVQAFTIRLTGAGGHAAIDTSGGVVTAMGELLVRLAEVGAGLEHRGAPVACAAGMAAAGSALAVVPTEATLQGTLRTYSREQAAETVDRLRRLCVEVAAERGIAADVSLGFAAPPVRNEPALAEVVLAAAKVPGAQVLRGGGPVAPSDDVSELLERVPGVYLFLGAGEDGGPHHAPTFAIDEDVLDVGTRVLTSAAIALAHPGTT